MWGRGRRGRQQLLDHLHANSYVPQSRNDAKERAANSDKQLGGSCFHRRCYSTDSMTSAHSFSWFRVTARSAPLIELFINKRSPTLIKTPPPKDQGFWSFWIGKRGTLKLKN
jgi:hypothetical protein